MPLTDNSKSPTVQMAQLVPSLLGLYNQVTQGIKQMSTRVYGQGPDVAIANVEAMGQNAETIYELAEIFQNALNEAAELLNKPAIQVEPNGYQFVPSEYGDGTGYLIYTAPTSSSSSGN
jgi:hypothetical protein